MNLETAEQRCLALLGESHDLFVPFERLFEYCCRDPACAALTAKQLLGFLRQHPEVTVIDGPPAPDDETERDAMVQAGVTFGPRVILNTRLPSREDMFRMMLDQFISMREVLNAGMERAMDRGETALADGMKAALARVEALERKLGELR